jgi:hypothetical protein
MQQLASPISFDDSQDRLRNKSLVLIPARLILFEGGTPAHGEDTPFELNADALALRCKARNSKAPAFLIDGSSPEVESCSLRVSCPRIVWCTPWSRQVSP